MDFKELMKEWDRIYRKERIFIIDPIVEWNPQQSTGYYYLPRIFALNNFNTPLTIISAPHPLDVYLDGQFINEVYEGDIIFPTSLNQRLEFKIPSWIFDYPYIPAGSPELYAGYYPTYNTDTKRFFRPFIFRKGMVNVKNINPFSIHFHVIQFSNETEPFEAEIYKWIKCRNFSELTEKTIATNQSGVQFQLIMTTKLYEQSLDEWIETLEDRNIIGPYEGKKSTILNSGETIVIWIYQNQAISNATLDILLQFKK